MSRKKVVSPILEIQSRVGIYREIAVQQYSTALTRELATAINQAAEDIQYLITEYKGATK